RDIFLDTWNALIDPAKAEELRRRRCRPYHLRADGLEQRFENSASEGAQHRQHQRLVDLFLCHQTLRAGKKACLLKMAMGKMAGGTRESPSHRPQKSGACYNPRLYKSMHGCFGATAWQLHVKRDEAQGRLAAATAA